jgi:cytochrome c oxidase cbb3-type subunit III
MIELPGGFWAGWITVITLVSLAGLLWLVVSVYFTDTGPQEAESQVWDETLREGSQPAPMWWFWLILALMVFSVVYLMLYPGLGSYPGLLGWSQAGHIGHRMDDYEARFGEARAEIAGRSIEGLQDDLQVLAAAQRVYDRNCAVCHGSEATGQASMFPNLRDDDWQWGGLPAQVEQSIRDGRKAVMVGWEATLGEEGVSEVVNFVRAFGSGDEDQMPGQVHYRQFCAACHGPDGKGNPALGAPNLTDDIWLYGGSAEAITESVASGRNGVMPAFAGRLDDAQIRMLVAWLTHPDNPSAGR